MLVEITYLTKNKILEAWLKMVAKKVGKKIKNKKSLSLVVVGEKKIKEINYLYRHKKQVTDVLSFEGEGKELGEIFLCLPMAKRQAQKFGLTLKEELARLLIHGFLHLAGFDHERGGRTARKMFALQDSLLQRFTKKYVSTE